MNVDTDLKADDEPEVVPTTVAPARREQSKRGNPDDAFDSAAVKLDQTYTHTETHNPLELHATTAVWEDSKLTLTRQRSPCSIRETSSRRCSACRRKTSRGHEIPRSGFGSKLWPWTHCPLAVAAARQLRKPVKIVISRKMMFQTVGHRPRTQQRVRLGATAEGKLVSLQHDYVRHQAILDNYHEDCGETTAFLYSVPNLRVHFGRARRNVCSHFHARTRRGAGTLRNRIGDE